MRVLVVDESPERAETLREGLERAGHEVVTSAGALLKAIERVQPGVIVIGTDSPGRDLLQQLAVVNDHGPRPVILFATDGSPEVIREAVKAGVASYVVDGLDPARVETIIDVAIARFEDFQRLRTELAEANLRLAERKLVERAKGLLMKTRGLDEDAAYAVLRKAAMDRKLKLVEVAQRVIEGA